MTIGVIGAGLSGTALARRASERGARSENSTGTYTPGVRKYSPTSALLASSAGLGWSSISVELRSHGISEASAIIPRYVEICLVVAGNEDGLVKRNAAGFYQEATPRAGSIWLSPAGVSKDI